MRRMVRTPGRGACARRMREAERPRGRAKSVARCNELENVTGKVEHHNAKFAKASPCKCGLPANSTYKGKFLQQTEVVTKHTCMHKRFAPTVGIPATTAPGNLHRHRRLEWEVPTIF
eukprot:384859-Rhodomonas_salina.3